MGKRKKSKSKHLPYRLAFKLYCFHSVMGYPAFNSPVRSAGLGCLHLFLSPPLWPRVQNKVAGFLPELPATVSPDLGSWGVESASPGSGNREGAVERGPGGIVQGKAGAIHRPSLSAERAPENGSCPRASAQGRPGPSGRCLRGRAGQGHAQPAADSKLALHVSMSSEWGPQQLAPQPIRVQERLFLK